MSLEAANKTEDSPNPDAASAAEEVDVDSVKNTLRVAILLCLACSVLVSFFAVGLRGFQEANRKAFKRTNILKAAGVWTDGTDLSDESFDKLAQSYLFDFASSEATTDAEAVAKINVDRDSTNPDKSSKIEEDVAGIKRRENQTVIYQIDDDGAKIVVLPIRGYGLWSTLKGFIALDISDLTTRGPNSIVVRGLTYYEQKETPGLGGEVDNPIWKAKWLGKKVYDKDWNVKAKVSKSAEGIYQVDALSGATITSRGVTNMLTYWLGDEGFRPYLKKLAGAEPTVAVEQAANDVGDANSKENHNG